MGSIFALSLNIQLAGGRAVCSRLQDELDALRRRASRVEEAGDGAGALPGEACMSVDFYKARMEVGAQPRGDCLDRSGRTC